VKRAKADIIYAPFFKLHEGTDDFYNINSAYNLLYGFLGYHSLIFQYTTYLFMKGNSYGCSVASKEMRPRATDIIVVIIIIIVNFFDEKVVIVRDFKLKYYAKIK